MEPEYMKLLRQHYPTFYAAAAEDYKWAAEWRDKKIEKLQQENERLVKENEEWRTVCGFAKTQIKKGTPKQALAVLRAALKYGVIAFQTYPATVKP